MLYSFWHKNCPMKFMKFIISSLILFVAGSLFGQEKEFVLNKPRGSFISSVPVVKPSNTFPVTVFNGDTIPLVQLREVYISGTRVFRNDNQQQEYNRLVRNVKKAYPYAILASAKLKEISRELDAMPKERARKKFLAEQEKIMKDQFEGELKNLTVNQGRILMKLIDRETGKNTYTLVKELRGTFQAFMWQTVARIFGSTLKSEFDAKGEDRLIEDIIGLIESGEI